MNEEYNPYCEVCGHCGEIGCCGIRNFIEKHIEGKTNCKNEGYIIQDLINLCDYKDKVFEENERLHNIIEEVKKVLNDKRRIMATQLLEGSYCNYEELLYQVDEEVRKILDKENK